MRKLFTLLALTLGLSFAAQAQTVNVPAGNITTNTTWSSSNIYVMQGYIYVTNGATLTIQPGTIIKGVKGSRASLIITRGAKLIARGNANQPIVFTSDQVAGSRNVGDWGGIVILGRAPINTPDCATCAGALIAVTEAGNQNAIEGDLDNAQGLGLYGGNDTADNSGVLSYVRIEYGGVVITPNNEINGLTMGGVGNGTQIDHIQTSFINDDAFEFFGGTVNAKYLISYRNVDDDFDTDFGFRGRIQFGFALRDSTLFDNTASGSSSGFESDNDGGGTTNTPQTAPTFSNITIIGPLSNGRALNATNRFRNGIHIRKNSATSLYNSIVLGFPTGILLDGTSTLNNFANDILQLRNNIVGYSNGRAIASTLAANEAATRLRFFTGQGNDSVANNAGLVDPFNYANPNLTPGASSLALSGASFTSNSRISNSFFTRTTYRGAFGANDNWTGCWTSFNPQNEAYTSPGINNAFTANITNPDTAICVGQTVNLRTIASSSSTGAVRFRFTGAGLNNQDIQNPIATPTTTTTFRLVAIDGRGCESSDSIRVVVNPLPTANFNSTNGANGQVSFTATTQSGVSLRYDFGVLGSNSDTANTANASFTYPRNGTYTVTLTARGAGRCVTTSTRTVTISGLTSPTRTINAGVITNNVTWDKDTVYFLAGFVYVANNATLTIEPGTIIRGVTGSRAALIITRDGRINARGTRNSPIVFTSSSAAGQRNVGDWGGIIILGKAPINTPDCSTCPGSAIAAAEAGNQNAIEGDLDNAQGLGLYGGNDGTHSSGVLSYVRIEYAGVVITPNNEINGLTMGGVGNGTTINYIQVSFANDDAYEWFGGTVNGKYLISYRNVDDDFDTDFGYSGKVQFGTVLRDSTLFDNSASGSSSGFESDNDGAGSTNGPQTAPVFSNITVVGPLRNATALNSTTRFRNGVHIRKNSRLSLFNSIVIGWPVGILLDGASTVTNYTSDLLNISNNIVGHSNGKAINVTGVTGQESIVRNKFLGNNDSILNQNGLLQNPFNYTAPVFRPIAGSPALTGASFSNAKLQDPFFTQTTYRGSYNINDFWSGCWSRFSPNTENYEQGPIVYTGAVANFNETISGQTVQFNSTGTSNATRVLFNFGVGAQTTDSSTSLNPTFTFPNQDSTYTVSFTAFSPCGDSTITRQVAIVRSSIRGAQAANMFVKVYPNPTQDLLNITLGVAQAEVLSLSVLTPAGQVVMAQDNIRTNAGNNQIQLNTANLAPGMYLVRLATEHGQKTVRFTVAR